MTGEPAIVWFRRDLRLSDNTALAAALQSGHPIIPLFILDPSLLRPEATSPARVAFMLHGVAALHAELQAVGGKLIVRSGSPGRVLHEILEQTGARHLFFNADYTPYARRRDADLEHSLSVVVRSYHDRLLLTPESIHKADGQPYVVYTPFKKQWRQREKPPLQKSRQALNTGSFADLSTLVTELIPEPTDLGIDATTTTLPPAGEAAAKDRFKTFLDRHITTYSENRDKPGGIDDVPPHTATSGLSPYIRFGMISTRSIYWACRDLHFEVSEQARSSISAFVDEIIWHEFYTHILWHYPVVKQRNFQRKYDAVAWRDAPGELLAWQQGRTGYPFVDAAMRQLNTSGWMHNRARMVVASFLTKHLLIHWRHGEATFMRKLLDGDLAANNGGWQWAAGTGTDAQPYFRIFNPTSQSRKFDPQGSYIRRWVPELRHLDNRLVHEPWLANRSIANYPEPMVDHRMARERALSAFKAASSTGNDH